MIRDYFNISWKQVRSRKVRSWLTLIGIFIGIAAIVSLITLGQGLKEAISQLPHYKLSRYSYFLFIMFL